MKPHFLLTLSIFLILLSSCSKNTDETQPEPDPAKIIVTINGSDYPTTVIGHQTWTTVNYNGPKGVNYNNGANDPTYGKLYTLTEAMGVALPSGWRLPSREDYNRLFASLGELAKDSYGNYIPSPFVTRKLLTTASWTNIIGKNESGFNAVASGHFRDLNRSTSPGFQNKSAEAVFLTTSYFTELGGSWAQTPVSFSIYTELTNNQLEIYSKFSDAIVRSADAGSLRFVKDN